MIAELLADPLLRHVLVMLWLLPCAIQDYRTRQVSNWLTVPLFIVAWPIALLTGHLALTFAVCAGVFVAWRWREGLGPADGKIAVGLAGMAPLALLASVMFLALAFLCARLRERQPARLPGAVGFYLGAAAATPLLAGWNDLLACL